MSYKFNLDHTLAIANIHDMITIDIKPETRCVIKDGDVEVQGYLTFRGSYLTSELNEALFEGQMPLDITLPYVGGAPDVQPEVISFDYRVDNKEALTLNLEVVLNGYTADETDELVIDARIDPVYEEVVIEPFNFDVSTATPYEADINEESCSLSEATVVTEEERCEEVAKALTPTAKEEGLEAPVHIDAIPYSPLVAMQEQDLTIEETQPEELPLEVVEEERPIVEEASERVAPKITDSAAALMEELFAMKRGIPFKEQEEIREVTTTQEDIPIATDEAIVLEVEAEEGVPEVVKPVAIADSVARQFADGETTIKMVYVGHENQTLGGVLERYEATLDDVWNLEALADGVAVGDCIMLRYEQTI